ncbi:unnamed protein product [Allacma fusca]|uniref:Uncharacterized protein n=1 Tax=Allacma fusca TaxID=39272 RepID=A0A8J2NYS1_9HEXA|nr:unnamed protein product [Allacma fusca]
MATQEWCRRVCIMALVGSLFVLTEVAGKPGPVGYGSYDNYNHGPSYNLIPEQPVVKKVVDFYAKPKYSFGYEVEDYYNQLSHGSYWLCCSTVLCGWRIYSGKFVMVM